MASDAGDYGGRREVGERLSLDPGSNTQVRTGEMQERI
jgi:hypothetical protein